MLPKIRQWFQSSHSVAQQQAVPSSSEHFQSQSASSSAEEANFYSETSLYTIRVGEINPTNHVRQTVSSKISRINDFKQTIANFNDLSHSPLPEASKLSTSARNIISFSNPFRRLNKLLRAEFQSNQSASSPTINITQYQPSKTKRIAAKRNFSTSVNVNLHEHCDSYPPPPSEFLSNDSISARSLPRSVQVCGPGLVDGYVDEDCFFDLIASSNDLQQISIAVDGPTKANIYIESIEECLYRVHYSCPLAGNYCIAIRYDGKQIEGSPYHISLQKQPADDVPQLHSINHVQARIEPVEFYINKPCIVNIYPAISCEIIQVFIRSSNDEKNNLPMIVHKSAKSQAYEVYFIPSKSGIHYLHVHLNNKPIVGNPIRLLVRPRSAIKSELVKKHDLFRGYVGALSQFFVSYSSDGDLKFDCFSVGIDAPSPIILDANETVNGYEFQFQPSQSGCYTISIRNGDEHIPGSPFSCRVDECSVKNHKIGEIQDDIQTKFDIQHQLDLLRLSMNENSSKVCVFGTGLYEAKKRRKASFKIDASQAGHGLLLVGLQSSMGSYERLAIKNVKSSSSEFIYTVTYRVKTNGHYLLSILYGPNLRHVPGSPYLVMVE